MTMKKGAGDDPFADQESDTESDDVATDAQDADSATSSAPSSSPAHEQRDPDNDSAPTSTESDADGSPDLPRIMARSSVKANRDSVLQFFVTEETAQLEDGFERTVAEELDIRVKDLMKLDLREAAYLVAMKHPEETAAILNEWGYEYR